MASRAILLVALASLLVNSVGRADDPKLPGSFFKPEDHLSEWNIVFLGKIIDAGPPQAIFAESMMSFHQIKIEASQVMKGSFDGRSLVNVGVFAGEEIPKAGGTYIFFEAKTIYAPDQENAPDHELVTKLVPATDDNIARVKALIAQVPAK